MAVDHGAAELEIAHAALELVGGGFGILHRQMREAGITVRALLDFLGEEIVRGARVANGGRGIALDLHARPGDRQHRAGDAGLVHHRQPLFAEVGERAIELRGLGRRDVDHGRPPIGLGGGIQEMLFERDLLDHWRLLTR